MAAPIMNRVTLTLEGIAAQQVLLDMKVSYAMLTFKSRLPPSNIANAPWYARKGRKGLYAIWVVEIDKARKSYQKALLAVYEVLPDVPYIELDKSRTEGHLIWDNGKMRKHAETWAKTVDTPENIARKALKL